MQHRIAESWQFFRFNAPSPSARPLAIEYPFAHLLLHFNKNKISQSSASISVPSRNYGNKNNNNSSVRRWNVFNGTAAMWRTTYACCIRAIASTRSLCERTKCSWPRVHVCICVGAINHIAFSFSRAIVRPESVRSVRVYSRDDDTITEPLAMPRNPPNQDYSFRFRSTTFFFSLHSFFFSLFPALDILLFLISGRILHAIEQKGNIFRRAMKWNLFSIQCSWCGHIVLDNTNHNEKSLNYEQKIPNDEKERKKKTKHEITFIHLNVGFLLIRTNKTCSHLLVFCCCCSRFLCDSSLNASQSD